MTRFKPSMSVTTPTLAEGGPGLRVMRQKPVLFMKIVLPGQSLPVMKLMLLVMQI